MSVEAEQSILGTLIQDNRKLDLINLDPNHFTSLDHKLIYQAIQSLSEKGLEFDVVTVFDYLQSKGEAVDLPYLIELSNEVPISRNIEIPQNILKRDYGNKQLYGVGMNIQMLAQDGGEFDENLDKSLSLFDPLKLEEETDIPSNITLINEYIEHLERIAELKGLDGLSTGLERLDDKLGGLKAGELIILGGRPGSGKSALALNIGLAQEKPVLFFSMEMPRKQVVQRSVASLGGVELSWLKGGLREDDSGWAAATHGMNQFKESKIIIDDRSSQTIQSIKIRAKREKDIGLIIVDYLQLMTGKGNTRNEEIGSISRGLKQLSKELQCPVIALSQLNRGVENRQNKRPRMADLRESGDIEADADLILFIYRDEYYYEDYPQNKGYAEVSVAKFRDGETGTVYVASELSKSRFKDYVNFTYQPYGGDQ